MADSSDKRPRVVVLGGCGFIGRHMVSYLVENQLAGKVLAVDKVPPQMAWLNPQHQQAFDSPLVEFKSANLLNPGSRENALQCDAEGWDFIINLAAEAKPNQSQMVYQQGIVPLSLGCAELASRLGVKKYVEVSDSHCYNAKKVASKEVDNLEPYTLPAECKMQVEKKLQNIADLNYAVIRPGITYGTGDRVGLTPWLILGAIYRHLGEPLRLLWHSDVHRSTVHVKDLCRAIWSVCLSQKLVSGQVFNVADNADTTLSDLAEIIAELFQIKYNFVGKTLSTLVNLDIQSVVEDANEKHLEPWGEICRIAKIDNTPLSPYATVENLSGHNLWLDNSKLMRETGFQLNFPKPTVELLNEVLQDYISRGLFPQES